MFKIDLRNIQAIGDAHIVIEDRTITEFTGDNSNGKSVISKIIEKLTSGDLSHKDVRCTLIKDHTSEGVALFTHDEKQLGIILRKEAKDSYIMYKKDCINNPDDAILRNINDNDAVKAIVRAFGFRVYGSGDICLQLHPTWGAIPFVTTNGSVNNAIVQDITTDKVADEFLKSFETITFPVFKDKIARLKKEKENAQAVLDNMESYNWKAYSNIYDRLSEVYQKIKDYEYGYIEDIPVPDLSILPVSRIQLGDIPIVEFYDLCPTLDCIPEVEDYVKVLNGVCPTCGRPLFEHEGDLSL